MNKPTISDFKDSYSSYYFADVLKPILDSASNPNYYVTVINNWYEFRKNELDNNNVLKGRDSLLKDYLLSLRALLNDIVKVYEIIDKHTSLKNQNKFNIQRLKVKSWFDVLANYSKSIKKNIEIDENEFACRIKNYLIDHLNECVLNLDLDFSINLLNSPFKNELDDTLEVINTSINMEEVIFYNGVNSNNQIESKQNPFPRIFTSADSWCLFNSFSEKIIYKLADYSFIFGQMHKDGLIHPGVKEKEFRAWLDDEFEITLDKLKLLDYCKTPRKEDLYNLLKRN
tara:strand:- start:156 stop:1010 length:855 start_codon:yes stop_codon:yes gene_type:complete